jgi:hypothetical protein
MVMGSFKENVTGVFATTDPAEAKAIASARNMFRAIGMLLTHVVDRDSAHRYTSLMPAIRITAHFCVNGLKDSLDAATGGICKFWLRLTS